MVPQQQLQQQQQRKQHQNKDNNKKNKYNFSIVRVIGDICRRQSGHDKQSFYRTMLERG